MNRSLPAAAAAVALACCSLSPTAALAVDFEYFKAQSCPELGKELDALQKAERAVQDGMKQ